MQPWLLMIGFLVFELLVLFALIWCWFKLSDVNVAFQNKRLHWLVRMSQTREEIRRLNNTLVGVDEQMRRWQSARPWFEKLGFIVFKKLVRII